MCRTPITAASARCAPPSSSARSPDVSDPIGAPGSMPLRPPSSPPDGSTENLPSRQSTTSSQHRRQRLPRDPDLSSYLPFHSLLDVGSVIERVLIQHRIKLYPSPRARKYTRG